MADLPRIENSIPVLQPPQQHRSSVTGTDIEAPYRQLSLTFEKAGETTMQVARQAAKVAGTRAVTQDEAGNIQVERVPVVGEAADDYQRAIGVATLAKGEALSRRDMIALRMKFEGDPDGYLKAVEAYRSEKVKQYDQAAGPAVAEQLGRIIDRAGTTMYRGLAFKKRRAELSNSKTAILGQASSISDDLVSMAEGGGSGSPEFQEMKGDYQALLSEATENPLLPFTPEDAKKHAAATAERVEAAGFVGTVRAAYQEGGSDGARAFVDEALGEQKWPEEKKQAYALRANDAIDALEQRDIGKSVASVRNALATRDARENEGYAALANGGMSQGWLDRYGDQLGEEHRDRIQRALHALGARSTPSDVSDDLTRAVLTDPASAGPLGADALIAGQMTRQDFQAFGQMAMQVASDAGTRPWANEIRRDVLLREPGAMGEVNEALSNPQITRGQAQEATEAVIDRHRIAERRRLAASLPSSAYIAAPRDEIKPADIEAGRARVVQAAQNGAALFSDLVAQSDLLSSWGRAVGREKA